MMDAVNAVMQAQDQQRQATIQTSLMRKSLDTQESIGAAIIQMIDSSNLMAAKNITPGCGQHVDVSG